MTEQELLEKVDRISCLLYQNKAQAALGESKEFLQILQNMIKNVVQSEVEVFSAQMLRELLETYQNQDVLGMADCLQEKVTIFIQFYFRQEHRSKENC